MPHQGIKARLDAQREKVLGLTLSGKKGGKDSLRGLWNGKKKGKKSSEGFIKKTPLHIGGGGKERALHPFQEKKEDRAGR